MQFKYRMHAPGPVSVPEESRFEMAGSQVYHRSDQFREKLATARRLLQKLMKIDWPVVLASASGTGGMQIAVHNLVAETDRVLVVKSGKFGARWVKMLRKKGCEVFEVKSPPGTAVDPGKVEEQLRKNSPFSAVFTTLVETSTLVRQPVEKIGTVLEDYNALHVVDAISALGTEEFLPGNCGVDAVVGASQKGLMTPPGLAFLTLNSRAQKRAYDIENPDFYFDLSLALQRLNKDGQTAWTGPVGLVRALVCSLQKIFEEGPENVYARHREIANFCRAAVKKLGLKIFNSPPAVIGTAVEVPESITADKLREEILKSYNMYLPGGRRKLEDRIVRLGHLGEVDYFDLVDIISALELGLFSLGASIEPGAGLKKIQQEFTEDFNGKKGDEDD